MKIIFDKEKNDKYEFLKIGKEYCVYGMMMLEQKLYYFICDFDETCPRAKPCDIFKISDHRLSRYWIFDYEDDVPMWIFPEWLKIPYFYDNLLDSYENEVQIFLAYKEAMNLEFPDSLITEIAQIGDEKWLICPFCIDAWISESFMDAVVRCPKCRNILNNPRYKNEYPHL